MSGFKSPPPNVSPPGGKLLIGDIRDGIPFQVALEPDGDRVSRAPRMWCGPRHRSGKRKRRTSSQREGDSHERARPECRWQPEKEPTLAEVLRLPVHTLGQTGRTLRNHR
jgi:hypothetical protein